MKKKYVKWQKASLIALIISFAITFIYALGFSTGITVLKQDMDVFDYIFKYYDRMYGLNVYTDIIPNIDSYYNNLIKVNNLFLYITILAFIIIAVLFAVGCYRRIRYGKLQNVTTIIGISLLIVMILVSIYFLIALYYQHNSIDFTDYNYVVLEGDINGVLSDNMEINVTTARNTIGFIIFGIDLLATLSFGYVTLIKYKFALKYIEEKQKENMKEKSV